MKHTQHMNTAPEHIQNQHLIDIIFNVEIIFCILRKNDAEKRIKLNTLELLTAQK